MFKVEVIYPYGDNTEIGEYDNLEDAQNIARDVEADVIGFALEVEPPVVNDYSDVDMIMDGMPYVAILNYWEEDNPYDEYQYEDFESDLDVRGMLEAMLPDED